MTVDYEEFFSESARLRSEPALSGLIMKHIHNPLMIGLHGGLPPPSAFPLSALSLEVSNPPLSKSLSDAATLAAAQQYNLGSRGYKPLIEWVTELTNKLHSPLHQVEAVITSGATQALEIAFSLLLNPGDVIICEEYTWSHAAQAILTPRGIKVLPVRLDSQGLSAEHLKELLESGDGKKPKAVYLIPTAQNPTGVNMSAQRKKDVYKICQEHNLIIIEDDAYFWLQWPNGSSNPPGLAVPQGFLSIDTDSRVIRVDTFSKVLGPGFRLGWISAPPQFAQKAALAAFGSTLGPSSISQVLLQQLLTGWGHDGFEQYVKQLQQMYAVIAEAMSKAAEEHLTGLAEWEVPTSGMFMWLKILGIEDAGEVMEPLIAENVVVVPGNTFRSVDPEGKSCPFVRISFAPVTAEKIQEGIARIGKVLKALSKALEGVGEVHRCSL